MSDLEALRVAIYQATTATRESAERVTHAQLLLVVETQLRTLRGLERVTRGRLMLPRVQMASVHALARIKAAEAALERALEDPTRWSEAQEAMSRAVAALDPLVVALPSAEENR